MGDHYLTVLAAIVLLAALVLNVNRSILYSSEVVYGAEAITSAVSVGQQLIDEIGACEFDENTLVDYVEDVAEFTAPDSLGAESGEVYPSFDDVDDFDGYSRVDSTSRMGNFTSTVSVSYVNPASPDVAVNTKTRMKKYTVTVTSNYLVGNLVINGYISY